VQKAAFGSNAKDDKERRNNTMRRYALSLAAAFLATAAVPSVAAAANAMVTADLNMRAGPSTSFPVVEVIPDDGQVTVHGCIGAYQWCDVTWQDARGWVSSDYLTYSYQNRYVPLVEYGERADIPIIVFSVGSYWDDYYRDRPWYGQRSRWVSVWRDDRRGIRDGRRGDRADRRENRAERRDAKVDRSPKQSRAERRELRDNRAERRERSENRAEHRGGRRDAMMERSLKNRAERRERSENRAERREGRDIATPTRKQNRAERGGQEGRQMGAERGEQRSGPKGGGEMRNRGSRPEGGGGGEQRGRGGREG
jgi:uncharacterized protein YraI